MASTGDAVSSEDSAEAVGTGLAMLLILPHVTLTVVGTLFGVIAFFILQVTSIWVRQKANDHDGYLVDSLGEGLSVASWVMLWFPLQLATMEVWRAVLRRRRMRVIERVSVNVLPDPDR